MWTALAALWALIGVWILVADVLVAGFEGKVRNAFVAAVFVVLICVVAGPLVFFVAGWHHRIRLDRW